MQNLLKPANYSIFEFEFNYYSSFTFGGSFYFVVMVAAKDTVASTTKTILAK